MDLKFFILYQYGGCRRCSIEVTRAVKCGTPEVSEGKAVPHYRTQRSDAMVKEVAVEFVPSPPLTALTLRAKEAC